MDLRKRPQVEPMGWLHESTEQVRLLDVGGCVSVAGAPWRQRVDVMKGLLKVDLDAFRGGIQAFGSKRLEEALA